MDFLFFKNVSFLYFTDYITGEQAIRLVKNKGGNEMSVLISAPTIQLIPSLAEKVGLNEAIVLQQLHFRLCISENWRDGYKWVYKTYEDWKKQEFPFWSVDTIFRTIRKLEDQGYLISTSSYNRMHADKTKWYRIDYDFLHEVTSQIALSESGNSGVLNRQNKKSRASDLPKPITKEVPKNTTNNTIKEIVEDNLDVVSVIDYLNERAKKQFKTSSKATIRLVQARFREGYYLEDFKKVIDTKVKEWLRNPRWEKYLRPSTLFNATNFENYLEESKSSQTSGNRVVNSFELDFSKGEF